MNRRELIRLLGGTALAASLSSEQLLALGRDTHRRARDWQGAGFFDHHQMHTVAAAGERILPATDTPGAMAAECHRFTERIVADHYDERRQRRLVDGLVRLDQQSAARFQRLFVQLSDEQQDSILAEVEGAAYEASVNGADSFWRDLKYLTLYGFYTSEIGIEQELGTDFFPGRFEGAAPIGDSSR